jgi:hypothetical protein
MLQLSTVSGVCCTIYWQKSRNTANKAPANVVRKERDKLADFQDRAEELREQIDRLG